MIYCWTTSTWSIHRKNSAKQLLENSCLSLFCHGGFISLKIAVFHATIFKLLGTIMSGLFVCCCCCGRTRYSEDCDGDSRFCAFVMNSIIGLSQFATIILCLVGWCWSIGWGITLISVSSKFERFGSSFSFCFSFVLDGSTWKYFPLCIDYKTMPPTTIQGPARGTVFLVGGRIFQKRYPRAW